MLGLPPVWYKSAPYRSRAVIDPKGVLADFGVTLPPETEIRIWDSTAETRFLVVPMRPAGTEGWSEERLAALGHPRQHGRHRPGEVARRRCAMTNSIHDMGGMHGFGPVEPEPNEPPFHAPWEGRVLAMQRAMGYAGLWTIDGGRASLEALPPLDLSRRVLLPALVSRAGAPGRQRTAWSARTRSPPAVRLRPGIRLNRKLTASDAEHPPLRISSGRRPAPARFKAGDRVRTSNINPATHTRLPRYARGKTGTVEAVRGCHVFPDTRRDRRRRQSAMALHGRVFGARIVGRGRRSVDQGVDRGVRALSVAGMSAIDRVAEAVPGLPRDADGPVFREPWEAQAFAMALALHERGLFTWPEWAATLADEIKRAQAAGDPDTGDTYYRHWLAALERLVAEKGVADPAALARYRDAWDRAAGAPRTAPRSR